MKKDLPEISPMEQLVQQEKEMIFRQEDADVCEGIGQGNSVSRAYGDRLEAAHRRTPYERE